MGDHSRALLAAFSYLRGEMILFHFHLSGAERVESWEENRICVQLFAPHRDDGGGSEKVLDLGVQGQ